MNLLSTMFWPQYLNKIHSCNIDVKKLKIIQSPVESKTFEMLVWFKTKHFIRFTSYHFKDKVWTEK